MSVKEKEVNPLEFQRKKSYSTPPALPPLGRRDQHSFWLAPKLSCYKI